MARTVRRLEKKDSSLMFREIRPPHGWKEDSDFHYLRLTLPGFEAKNVTIHMDKYGHLAVRGTQQVTEHKYMSFEEKFDVPNDAILEEADGRFENDQIYCITIPKRKKGQRDGHAISMPKGKEISEDDQKVGAIHKYDREEGAGGSSNHRNPLKLIKAEQSRKRTLFFMALLIALMIAVTVVLVVKFRHR